MKIFISHSSKNQAYGRALVNLLTGVGVDHDSIIFTSDTLYGIPVGENIFNWLKNQISERPFVIYLLSPDYYSSVACLNEMGAAWVVENQHAAIFAPNFDLDDSNFRNGALDPREIGFFINDEDRVTEFIESLRVNFAITPKQVVINSKRREFLQRVDALAKESDSNTEIDEKRDAAKDTQSIRKSVIELTNESTFAEVRKDLSALTNPNVDEPKADLPQRASRKKQTSTERYFQDFAEDKLKDEEVMVIYYAADTARFNLGVGWRTDDEVNRIRGWEDLNELGHTLSMKYDQALKRLDLRTLTEVSETTSHGNPRQVTLVEEMKKRLLELPEAFFDKCSEITRRAIEAQAKKKFDDDFPF